MNLLVEVFVDQSEYWNNCLDGGSSLVTSENLIFLKTCANRLQKGVQDRPVKKICVLTQGTYVWVQDH